MCGWEVWSKPGEKPLAPLGDAGETTCSKCVEKLMSGATYRRGYRPSRMIRWSDWKKRRLGQKLWNFQQF